jgi:hypothetical protein
MSVSFSLVTMPIESRFQRSWTNMPRSPGAMPQAGMKSAVGAKAMTDESTKKTLTRYLESFGVKAGLNDRCFRTRSRQLLRNEARDFVLFQTDWICFRVRS